MQAAKLTVLGLGGAGNNLITRMTRDLLPDHPLLTEIRCVAANTDQAALEHCETHHRVQLGERLTGGTGAGGRSDIGAAAAMEAQAQLRAQLQGSDLVFLVAGMGGGTGTGAAPVAAQAAREAGALTVALVTRPFRFEGPRRAAQAREGLARLAEQVDALIVLDNERLLPVTLPGRSAARVTVRDAFLTADRVLFHGVKGIAELLDRTGLVNVDFADVRSVLSGCGEALMSLGVGYGRKRAREAASNAVNSPLLERSVEGATRLIVNVLGPDNLTLEEAQEVVEFIRHATGQPEPDVLFGVGQGGHYEDETRVTLIATGFTRGRNWASSYLDEVRREARGRPQGGELPAFLRFLDSTD